MAETEDVTLGYKMLAASILYEAIRAWENEDAKLYNEVAEGMGYVSAHADLIEFFESDWCLYLLVFLDISPRSFFKRLGLTKLEKCGISNDTVA